MSPFVLGAIFARGGSKGLPRKNVRVLAGKPLIAHAIETARASRLINRLIVSTDDGEIARVAREYGAEVPFIRPRELALDETPEWLAWQHALRAMQDLQREPEIDVFVSIPPTSPLRAVEDIDACIRTLLESEADMVITVKAAERNPYFNMVVLDKAGYAGLVLPTGQDIGRRQAAPPVYEMTTVAYAARTEFVLRAGAMFQGKVKAVLVPRERGLDIDTELDLQFAEFLLSRQRQTSGR